MSASPKITGEAARGPAEDPDRPHVAVIMDGSGKWAATRAGTRSDGHRAGLVAVRRIVDAAPALGVGTLTLFGFSSDNWKRPAGEVSALMEIFRGYLDGERERLTSAGIESRIIGRRDRLPRAVVEAADALEAATAGGRAMRLRIALDYSGRDLVVEAARRFADAPDRSAEAFARALAEAQHDRAPGAPPIDLLIRTGGEVRLSDCFLYEIAHSELWFTATYWPDFTAADLARALADFRVRDRRYGALSAATGG